MYARVASTCSSLWPRLGLAALEALEGLEGPAVPEGLEGLVAQETV